MLEPENGPFIVKGKSYTSLNASKPSKCEQTPQNVRFNFDKLSSNSFYFPKENSQRKATKLKTYLDMRRSSSSFGDSPSNYIPFLNMNKIKQKIILMKQRCREQREAKILQPKQTNGKSESAEYVKYTGYKRKLPFSINTVGRKSININSLLKNLGRQKSASLIDIIAHAKRPRMNSELNTRPAVRAQNKKSSEHQQNYHHIDLQKYRLQALRGKNLLLDQNRHRLQL